MEHKKKGRSRKANPLRRLSETAKKSTVYLVCVSLIATSLLGSYVFAANETPESSEEAETEFYSMELDVLCDALEDAVRNGETVDEDEFEFSGNNADEYEKLFDTKDGLLYEVYPALDEEGDSLTLKTFARVVASDIAKDSEEEDEDSLSDYNVTGNEEIIFLLVNDTEDEVSARIHVTTSDEVYETKKITVPGNESITLDTFESENEVEYFVINDKNENVETAALKVETNSDADETTVSSNSTGSVSINVVATEKSESASDAVASNATKSGSSSAYTDGSTAMSGTIYDATTVDGQSAVAFVTTLKKFGVDYGIVTLDEVDHVASITNEGGTTYYSSLESAINSAQKDDYVTLLADIEVDCSEDNFATITVGNLTVDLAGHKITVKGTDDEKYLFYVDSGSAFTLMNGTIDGESVDNSGETVNSTVTAIDSHADSDSIIVDSVTIQNFGAAKNGVIYAEAGNLTVTDCIIQNNQTHGIHANGCNDITITGCTISGNTTGGDGGGIYIINEHTNICIEHNTISCNEANDGGGIYILESQDASNAGSFKIVENVISENEATGNGGYNRYGYPLGDGGGIYFEAPSATASEDVGDYDLSGNTITYNTAAGYGGGIELKVDVDGREVVIKSGIIAGNSAYWGGGIDSSFSTYKSVLHLYNAIITQNVAQARGGGLWACPTSETTMNETFGAAIYGNTASGRSSAWQYGLSGDEIRFEGYDTDCADPTSASGYAHVSERALGGTLMDWYADDDSRGNRYSKGDEPVDVTSDRYTGFVASFGLHGELSDEGIALAEEDALLYIVGNTSQTVGGGIATNTAIDFGSTDESTSLTVTANKVWIDENGNEMTSEETADYSVDITLVRVDENRGEEQEEETITLNAADGWTWDFEDLPTAYMTADYNEATGEYTYTEHPYTYTVKEVNAVSDGNFSVKVESSKPTVNEKTGNSEQTITVTNTMVTPEVQKAVRDTSYEDETKFSHEDEADNNDYLEYRLEADHIGGTHNLVLHDYLDDQLDINTLEIERVILYKDAEDKEGRELEAGIGYIYTVTDGTCSLDGCNLDGCSFEISIVDKDIEDLTEDAYVIVVFDIEVKEDVEDFDDPTYYLDEIDNFVSLSFTTFSASAIRWTDYDKAETFSYGFDVYKYTGADTPLGDAEFILSRYDTGYYAKFEDAVNGVYLLSEWVVSKDDATPIVTGSDGNAVIEGLHEGMFTLTEIKAPDGYSIINETTSVEISAEDWYAPIVSVNGTAVSDETVRIFNNTLNEVSGRKTWDDNSDQDGTRPEYITIHLYADGNEIDSVKVTADDNWSWNFTNLPKYTSAGVEIVYTITEETVGDYVTSYDGYDVTNRHAPGETNLTVQKIWQDDGDRDGERPTEITVELLADGVSTGTTAILSDNNDWHYTFEGLDKYEAHGTEIVYSIAENDVEDYVSWSERVEETTYIYLYNEHTSTTVAVSGSKTWSDNGNSRGRRPSSITIRLYADGDEIDSKTVTADDGWAWSFTNLPKYHDHGVEIVYTISEDAVSYYTSTVNGYDVTNTYSSSGSGSSTSSSSSGGSSSGGGVRPGTSSGPGADNVDGESGGSAGSSDGDSSSSIHDSITADDLGALPATGESNMSMVLMGLCAVFVVLLAALFYMRRRTPREDE